MRKGAIILCGGKSTRMGRDKATLPFGPELMLQRVVRLINEVVPPRRTVVVAALGQALPPLHAEVRIARDSQPDHGPLEGLAAGLQVLEKEVDAVYATACDVPLLVPALVEYLFDALESDDIVVPYDGKHHHPLAAVYRPSVLAHVSRLLDAQRLRPRFLFDEVPTREIHVNELRAFDPQLTTLENLNHPQDYAAALQAAGYPPPAEDGARPR